MKEFNDLRFERSPLNLADESRPFMSRAKGALWEKDRRLKLGLYFKGNHKSAAKRIRDRGTIDFIRRQFDGPDEVFSSIFDTRYIRENLDLLLRRNLRVTLNMLTVKLWMGRQSWS